MEKKTKCIPNSIKLTPRILLYWFLGEGYCSKVNNKTWEIAFSAQGFDEEELNRLIVPQIIRMGINCRIRKNNKGCRIAIYKESFKDFYKKIGVRSPVPCYDYKFRVVEELFPELLEEIDNDFSIDYKFKEIRESGFPFIFMSKKNRLESFKNLINIDPSTYINEDIIDGNKTGLKLANYYHPQIFEIKTKGSKITPIDVYKDDDKLRKIISDLYNKYGKIKNSDIRNRCRYLSNNIVMNFRPIVAKFIIEKYSNYGDKVLDPCSGFGGRLLGTVASGRKYFGVDVEYTTIKNLKQMVKDLNIDNAVLACSSFEDFTTEEEFNLIFTSPPYYDLEEYNNNNPKQSNIKYKDYKSWKEGFLKELVNKSYLLLKNNGFFCINISNTDYNLEKDFLDICYNKFTLIKKYRINYGAHAMSEENRYEPIFVLKKN